MSAQPRRDQWSDDDDLNLDDDQEYPIHSLLTTTGKKRKNVADHITIDLTDEPPSKKQKTDTPCRNWFLTWNNHTEASIKDLLSIPNINKYCIQEEKGKKGTPHLQGVITFKHEKTWSTLRKHAPIFWERCKNIAAAKNYCSKLETASGKRWVRGFRVERVIIDPMDGKTPYAWQKRLTKIVEGPIDTREVFWVWSHKGNVGKTSWCKHHVLKNSAIVVGGKSGDAYYCIAQMVAKKQHPHLVVFDIPRSQRNTISYAAIEGIKNGMFFSPKYEAVMCVFNPPHVIVFANEAPDTSQLSSDRWTIINLDDEKDLRHLPHQQARYNFAQGAGQYTL